jgi:hypothetical protein
MTRLHKTLGRALACACVAALTFGGIAAWSQAASSRNLRLDQPQSPPRKRFRTRCDHCGRFHSSRDDPPHAAPLDQINPLSMNPNFLDRL